MLRILVTALLSFIAASAWAADTPAALTPANAKPAAAAPLDQTPAKPFVYKHKESDLIIGSKNAPVTIVEYASLSCHHCAHFFTQTLPEITTKYIDTGKVKLVYRHYPLNDAALKAAELVQCSEPAKRHAFVKVLFSTQLKWGFDKNYREALANIAVLGGMDRTAFESCMNNKAIEKSILGVAKEAADDYKVNSTPTFYINTIEYKGERDAASMSRVIDIELAKIGKK